MIHLTVICGGRAVPLLWKVLKHQSASVEFREYLPLLRKAQWLLRDYPDVMFYWQTGVLPTRRCSNGCVPVVSIDVSAYPLMCWSLERLGVRFKCVGYGLY
jgi:hypothetical protein